MQVFLNLIKNAVQACSRKKDIEPGEIVVSAEKEGTKINISVEDNGLGIPKSLQEKVFDPFFKIGNLEDHMGLGLTICRNILKSHGSEIKIQTAMGRGTKFSFSLPVN